MPATSSKFSETISRNGFMIGVTAGITTVIGAFYVGLVLKYLYPANATDTPPLPIKLSGSGITPVGASELPWIRGVAGPFYYPTVRDKSVVVGMFVEQKVSTGQLTRDNLRAVEQTCTHLGCPVNWVPADNRFECPCHGSQFNRNLSVYHGPAAKPLWEHRFILQNDNMTILGRK
jgi:Rieske Fe-S protein